VRPFSGEPPDSADENPENLEFDGQFRRSRLLSLLMSRADSDFIVRSDLP
jgi:hypothetical protein